MIKVYICRDCKATFETPIQWQESHGLDSPPWERFSACPACLDLNFIEIKEYCDLCGDPCVDEYVELKDNTVFCADCFTVKDCD